MESELKLLAIMMVGVVIASACWATRWFVYPDQTARIDKAREEVARIQTRLDATDQNQIASNELADLNDDIDTVERELNAAAISKTQRIRAWLSAGQMLGILVAVAAQLLFLRRQLAPHFSSAQSRETPSEG